MVPLIRPATADDDARVFVLVERMLAEAPAHAGRTVDEGKLWRLIEGCRWGGVLLVVEDEDGLAGFAAALVAPHAVFQDVVVACEVGVYLDPSARLGALGLRLVSALEAACAALGATELSSADGTGLGRVGALYHRRGFTSAGEQWRKALKR